ncbi:MAG: hypothetical protein HY042_01160 [Spirochaetia bacterium]|nr:hypothetical protein [Spirochaetia bacterium]
MGRTVAPYSWQLEIFRKRFAKFRRALRKEDQEIFDRLMRYAKIHVQSGVLAASSNPADALLLSVIVEQERYISNLEKVTISLEETMKECVLRIHALEAAVRCSPEKPEDVFAEGDSK